MKQKVIPIFSFYENSSRLSTYEKKLCRHGLKLTTYVIVMQTITESTAINIA